MIILSSLYGSLLTIPLLKSFLLLLLDIQNKKCRRYQVRVAYVSLLMLRVFVCVLLSHIVCLWVIEHMLCVGVILIVKSHQPHLMFNT